MSTSLWTVGDVFLNATSTVRLHGKGNKNRTVVIADETAALLKNYMQRYLQGALGTQPLITNRCRQRIDRDGIAYIVKKYAEQIRPEHPNLPKSCYPHMIRRTKSTNMYRDGADLELISRILGHSSTETTKIYAIPSIEMMRNVMETGRLSTNETPQWPDDEAELARQFGLR